MTTKATEAALGARVRALRLERRWTQARLAVLLGVSQGHLSQLEKGTRSFSAAQLLIILRQFNVLIDYFSTRKTPTGGQIQNALARQGAAHLLESEEILPSQRLRDANAAIREALVSADSARQVAAIAPVLVDNAGQLNLHRLRVEFAELGLGNRFGWVLDCVREAIRLEEAQVLSREWRLKYRRAALVIDTYVVPYFALNPTPNPDQPPPFEILDPEITSPEALREAKENLSPIALKWRIATKIEVDDFVRALRGARGSD